MNTLTLMRRVRLKTFVRRFTRGRGRQRLQYVSFAVLGGFLFLMAFFFSLVGFRALLGIEGGEELAALALAGVYTLAAFALVFVGLATALYTMYLSKDLDVLAAMPLKERTIFAYKFWETLLGNSAPFVVLALPVLLAYGVAARASVLFYPAVLVVSVLVLVIPTGLCVLLIMPLMRLVPAGKAKEIVGALGILAGSAFYVAQFWFAGPPSRAGGSRISLLQALSESPVTNVPPGSWASDALVGAAFLEWGRLIAGLVPLAALSAGVYAVCLSLTGWAYATGRARAAESGGRAHTPGWFEGMLGWLPQDVRAVAVKDLTSLLRDLRRLALVAAPAAMLFAFSAIRFQGAANPGGGLLSLVPYLGASGFAALISFQAGVQAVGIEGRSYWFLAAAPISPERLLAGKWVAIFSVGMIAALLGSVVVSISLGFYLPGLLLGAAAGIVVSAIVSLYAVGISALFPRFDWENPRQAASPAAGFLFLACLAGFAILAALAAALAFVVSGFVPLWASVTGAAVLWAVCAAIPGYVVYAAGAERLRRLEWEL